MRLRDLPTAKVSLSQALNLTFPKLLSTPSSRAQDNFTAWD